VKPAEKKTGKPGNKNKTKKPEKKDISKPASPFASLADRLK